MNPQQRAGIVQTANANVTAHNNALQQNTQLSNMQQQMVAMREREVNMVLSRPDVVALSTSLDARFGKVGVLREEMINRGKLYHAQGMDISAEQALNEVLQLAGIAPGQGTPVTNPGAGQAPQKKIAGTGQVLRPQNKQVIKNVGSGGKSPTKQVIKSMDDLRKRRDQLAAAGR
jgi:hypothetical protein